MQDPAREIDQAVRLMCAADDPDIQKTAILKYYAPDAEFRHPLCNVPAGPGSRNQILGIYQWYRVMSPKLKIETRQITYDEPKKQLFLEAVQEFHIRWSPLHPAPGRLIVHLTLRPSDEDPGLLVISQHEDFYHPDDIMALLVPPLVPVVRILLRAGSIASNVNAHLFSLFGYWASKSQPGVSPSCSADEQERRKID